MLQDDDEEEEEEAPRSSGFNLFGLFGGSDEVLLVGTLIHSAAAAVGFYSYGVGKLAFNVGVFAVLNCSARRCRRLLTQ